MPNVIPKDEQKPTLKTPQELVHIKHKITLLQYKYWVLMVRAYREAYEHGERFDSDKEYCYLSMSQLQDFLGYAPKTTDIEHDLEAIRREPITFNILEKDGQKAKTGRGFISEWKVSSSRIGVVFPPVIRDAVEHLDDKTSLFHLLNWRAFNSFTGKYEALIYKLCKDYVAVGGPKPFTVEKFRAYMGVKDREYPDFKRLNQWVISGPIKRINESELSDILVRVEFEREQRKVVRIKFRVSAKRQTIMDFGDHPVFRFAKITIEPATKSEYLALRAPDEVELCIERANEYGAKQEATGKTVNYGGLYRTAIEEGWHVQYAEKKAKKDAIEKRKRKTVAEATATTEAEKKEAELRGQEITETLDRFDALSSEKKDALRAQFLETLPVAGMKKSFEKNGERHTMHRASFVKFFDVQMRK